MPDWALRSSLPSLILLLSFFTRIKMGLHSSFLLSSPIFLFFGRGWFYFNAIWAQVGWCIYFGIGVAGVF